MVFRGLYVCSCLFVDVCVSLSFKAFSSYLGKKFPCVVAFPNTHVKTLVQIIFCSVFVKDTLRCWSSGNLQPLVYRFLSQWSKLKEGGKHGYLVSSVFVSSAAAPASLLLILRHVFTLLLLHAEVVFANI